MRSAFVATVVAVLLTALGCAGGEGGSIPEPNFNGSADFFDNAVRELGEITIDGERTGEFEHDFDFQGYTFTVGENAVVDIEVPQRGTTRDLDPTMFVYGPLSSHAPTRLAFDNDSGWGPYPRITGLALPEAGRYLIVLGTATNAGRGTYTLTLGCASESCVVVPDEVLGECDSDAADYIRDCVYETVMDYGYEMAESEAFEMCTDSDVGDDCFDYLCGWSNTAPWCAAGLERFQAEMWPACVAEVAADYPDPLDPEVDLIGLPLNDALESIMEVANDSCEYSCWNELALYRYEWEGDEVPSVNGVVAAIRLEQDSPGPGAFTASSAPSLDWIRDVTASSGMEGVVDAIFAEFGDDAPLLGELSANWYAAAGAEAWATVYVLYFPNQQRVAAIRMDAGED